jgi:hypothetical protein
MNKRKIGQWKTQKMPTKLLNAIYEFLVKERDGWDTKGKEKEETKQLSES